MDSNIDALNLSLAIKIDLVTKKSKDLAEAIKISSSKEFPASKDRRYTKILNKLQEDIDKLNNQIELIRTLISQDYDQRANQ